MNAKQIWQAALGELELQTSRANYETWLRNTRAVSHESGVFTIGVANTFAKEWLEGRFLGQITETLARIVGRAVEVSIVVAPPPPRRPAEATQPLPLVAEAEPAAPPAEGVPALPEEKEPLRRGGWAPHPKFTFANFIEGKSNQMAYAAARAVADRPADAYNPLFIYGGVGLGKTHLLHAIAHVVMSKGQRVLYVSSETFTNDLINAIRDRRTEEFRQRYRRNDVLLVDDIQFIAGKESTQEEFFHTFNTLHEANRQVVISSDRSPKAIVTLEERLRSRFEWGLITDIQPPELETRIAILRAKAAAQPIAVSSQVIEFLAQRIQNSIRELEGALNRVTAQAQFQGLPLTVELAANALQDLMVNPARRFVTPSQIVETVARYYQVNVRAIRGQQRNKTVVLPRQVAMYLLREETDLSLLEIGRELGGRDHSTVLHGHEKILGEMEVNDRLRKDLLAIREALYASARP